MRKGDIITIRATVVSDHEPSKEKLYVRPFGHYDNIFVGAEYAKMEIPFFQKLDRVVTSTGHHGEVIATFDDQVWVRADNGCLDTYDATTLVLSPEGREEVSAAA